MKSKFVFLLIMFMALTACKEAKVSDMGFSVADKQRSADSERYLAYEHYVTIDLAKPDVEPTFHAVLNECNENQDFSCTVLDSEISNGKYTSASIRLRLNPPSIESILSLAAKEGAITRQKTHVEDLAEPIVDSERQLKMLEGYYEDLLRLKIQSQDEIDALIKVTAEIASTQSKLEALKGENAYLRQRVDLDLLNLNLVVEKSRTFWSPISDSTGEFKSNLSDGISEAITGFAYLLPWLFILIPLVFLVRYFWRRKR